MPEPTIASELLVFCFAHSSPTLPLSGRQEAIAIEAGLMVACPLEGLVRSVASQQTASADLRGTSSAYAVSATRFSSFAHLLYHYNDLACVPFKNGYKKDLFISGRNLGSALSSDTVIRPDS